MLWTACLSACQCVEKKKSCKILLKCQTERGDECIYNINNFIIFVKKRWKFKTSLVLYSNFKKREREREKKIDNNNIQSRLYCNSKGLWSKFQFFFYKNNFYTIFTNAFVRLHWLDMSGISRAFFLYPSITMFSFCHKQSEWWNEFMRVQCGIKLNDAKWKHKPESRQSCKIYI